MNFSELKLHGELLRAVQERQFTETTPIQEAVIPHILQSKDVAGLAQTGTGKTAAFLLPLMDRILRSQGPTEGLTEDERELNEKRRFNDWRAGNFILIMVPTRELAEQVLEETGKLAVHTGLKGVAIYGGTAYEKQIEGLKAGVEFVIGTPGRLIDLHKNHHLDLKQVRGVVFDEADRMFDMGFKEDMRFLLRRIPTERQYLCFSATLNFDVLNMAYMFGAEPIEFNLSRDQAKADNVKDELFHIGQGEKASYLLSIIRKYNPRQVIVFSNFKHNVDRVARFLSSNGHPAVAISSLLTQAQRLRVMEQFKAENDKNILVATDLAARGLDIKGVDMVINYELPDDAETYVHRIGRTGRAGAEGVAFSLCSERDVEALQRIEDYVKHKLPIGWLDDAEIVREHKEFPRDFERSGRPEGFERKGPPRSGGDGRRGGPGRERRFGDSGPRREGGGRGPRRDHPPRERSEEVSGAPVAGGEVHRDRLRGRHGQGRPRTESRPHGPNSQGGPRRSSGRRPENTKAASSRGPSHSGKLNIRPLRKKSVTEKVKGFFKRLFS